MIKIISVIILFITVTTLFSQSKQVEKPGFDGRYRVAIIDVIAPGMEESRRQILTEVFRTEVFKMNLFHIVERGEIGSILEEHKLNMSGLVDDSSIIRVGQFLKTDKLFVCKIGRVFSKPVVHFRVIDVNTSSIDFSENVFIDSEDQIFDAMKEIAKKIEIFYTFQQDTIGQNDNADVIAKKWGLLGASQAEIRILADKKLSPDKYLEMRQYSITFSISNYINASTNTWDMNVVKNFLQAGISYDNVEKALKLGIFELNHYRYTFKQAGYSFEDYLQAYENRQVSVQEYSNFRKGFRKDRLILGLGGVSDSLPVMNAQFSFYGAQVGWERFLSEYQRGNFKYSLETGLYMIKFVSPIPYFQFSVYAGEYPFYAKLTGGVHAEVILGGHTALFFRFGMEIGETVEWNVTMVPWGTQPGVSYNDLTSRPGDAGYIPIGYPYYGAFINFKI